jgi:potassium efflux system protein
MRITLRTGGIFLVGLALLGALAGAPAHAVDLSEDLVQSRLNAVEQLPDSDQKTTLRDGYLKVLQTLQAAREFEREADEYTQALTQAPQKEAEIRARTQALRDRSPEQIAASLSGNSLEELEQQLARIQGDLAEKSASLDSMDKTLATQEAMAATRRDRAAAINQKLRDTPTEKSDVAPEGAPGEAEAAAWQTKALAQSLASELKALQAGTASQPARLALGRAQRAALARELDQLQQERRVLDSMLEQARSTASEKARLKLESLTTESPLVTELATRNLALIERQAKLGEELARANNCRYEFDSYLSQVQDRYASARRRVEFARESVELGHILITQLEESRAVEKTLPPCKLVSRPADIIIERIALEEELRDLDSAARYIEQLVASRSDSADISRSDRRRAEALARDRQKLLSDLISLQTTFVTRLGELRLVQKQLLEQQQTYDEFLFAYLMWVRSHPVISPQSLSAIPGQLAYAVQSLRGIDVRQVRLNPISAGLWLVAGVLLLGRRRMADRLRQLMARMQRPRSDSINLALATLGVIALRCLPVPLVILGFGQLLTTGDSLGTKLGTLLLYYASAHLLITSMRELARPDGVAERMFYWPKGLCVFISRESRWMLRWWLPLVALAAAFYALGSAANNAEVPRLLGLAACAALARRWMRPDVKSALVSGRTSHMRLRLLRSAILLLLLTTAVVLATGYVHTVLVFAMRLLGTMWMIWGLIIVHATLLRWLLIIRRRLRLRELLETLASAEAGGDTEQEAERVGLNAISEASTRLLRFVIIVVGVGLVWLVWEPVMPALNILSEITLWSTTAVGEGNELTTRDVSLADLIIILALTIAVIVGGRTLPNLLELLLRQQPAISAGARYTITTLTGYLIFGGGLLVVLSLLGLSWSKLQWLVAALGVGIGFGLQEIVANFISGIIILFERPIRVGDTVTIGETDGQITKIRIRATTLRDWNGKELVVPNKEFVTGRLLNWTLSDTKLRIIINVGIAYGSDLEAAIQLLETIVREDPVVLEDPAPVVYMAEFGDNALQLSARFFVPGMEQLFVTKSRLHRVIYQRYNEAGITIAFPQRDVHLDSDKPLRVSLEQPADKSGSD